MKIIVFLFIISLFVQQSKAQNPFSEAQPVQLQTVPLDNVNHYFNTIYRAGIVFQGSYLIITDVSNRPSMHVLEIHSPGNVSYYGGFGDEGRGPENYLSPSDVVSSSETLFYVYDAGNRKLVPYNSSFEVQQREIITIQSAGLPVSIHADDQMFFLAGVTPNSRFEVMNKEGTVIDTFGELETIGSNIPPRLNALAWHSYSAYSPSHQRIALFSRSADKIDLFCSKSGELLNSKYNSDSGTPDVSVRSASSGSRLERGRNAKTAFIWAASNDETIYALYSGKRDDEEYNNYGDIIFTFDWDLNLTGFYQLDHQSFSIEADTDGNLYSVYTEMGEIRFIEKSSLNMQ